VQLRARTTPTGGVKMTAASFEVDDFFALDHVLGLAIGEQYYRRGQFLPESIRARFPDEFGRGQFPPKRFPSRESPQRKQQGSQQVSLGRERRDNFGRVVQDYRLSRRVRPHLERLLGVRFFAERSEDAVPAGPGHTPYACREVRQSTGTPGCEDFVASDDATALVKCALIAGRNRWFGGVASRGSCARS
jgi:hypothetical protein